MVYHRRPRGQADLSPTTGAEGTSSGAGSRKEVRPFVEPLRLFGVDVRPFAKGSGPEAVPRGKLSGSWAVDYRGGQSPGEGVGE